MKSLLTKSCGFFQHIFCFLILFCNFRRKTLTRSKLHSESESEGNKTPVKGRKGTATKQLKIEQFSTKATNRNV